MLLLVEECKFAMLMLYFILSLLLLMLADNYDNKLLKLAFVLVANKAIANSRGRFWSYHTGSTRFKPWMYNMPFDGSLTGIKLWLLSSPISCMLCLPTILICKTAQPTKGMKAGEISM